MRICLTFALIVCAATAASVSMADTVQKTAYGQQWSGLKHISLPSIKPLTPSDTEKLSQTAKNVWSAYEKYYDRFYRAANFSTISERSYFELNAQGQDVFLSGARSQRENSSSSGHYDPEKFAKAKRQKRLGLSLMQEAGKIKEEAKRNGEDWAKNDFPSP